MNLDVVVQADSSQEIPDALWRALAETLARMSSEPHFDHLLAQALRARVGEVACPPPPPAPHPTRARAIPLTAREQEILARISAGCSNKEIARDFGLSLHTIKRHVANILSKLGVGSRVQAVAWMLARH